MSREQRRSLAVDAQDTLIQAEPSRIQIPLVLRQMAPQQPGFPSRIILSEHGEEVRLHLQSLWIPVQEHGDRTVRLSGETPQHLECGAMSRIGVVSMRHEDKVRTDLAKMHTEPGVVILAVERVPGLVLAEAQKLQAPSGQAEEPATCLLLSFTCECLVLGGGRRTEAVLYSAGGGAHDTQPDFVPSVPEKTKRYRNSVKVVGMRSQDQDKRLNRAGEIFQEERALPRQHPGECRRYR